MTEQLTRLVQPFNPKLVHANPGGGGRGEYVSHSAVVEKLLAVVGPFSFEISQVFRGPVKGKADLGEVVVGCTARLTCRIDGQVVTIEEVGDCEQPANWPHDGARMKDAASDAIKRCAMRIGVGLHLWSQDEFFIHGYLSSQQDGATAVPDPPVAAGDGPWNRPVDRVELPEPDGSRAHPLDELAGRLDASQRGQAKAWRVQHGLPEFSRMSVEQKDQMYAWAKQQEWTV